MANVPPSGEKEIAKTTSLRSVMIPGALPPWAMELIMEAWRKKSPGPGWRMCFVWWKGESSLNNQAAKKDAASRANTLNNLVQEALACVQTQPEVLRDSLSDVR